MKKMALPLRIALFLFIGLATSNCARPDPELLFTKDGCQYKGPTSLTHQFNLRWTIQESPHSASIHAIVQLAAGKTVGDLSQIPASEPPPAWVQKLGYALEFNSGSYVIAYDLDTIYHFDDRQPIFIVCFFTDMEKAIGAIGPIRHK
jgi:hypothetical protein